jgi:hypothetical protein
MFKHIVKGMILALAVGFGVACSPPPPTPSPTLEPPTSTVAPNTPASAPTPIATLIATLAATPSPVRSPSPAASSTPGPRENLLAAYDAALAKIKTYRAKVILDMSRQDSPERIIEVILPDRFRQIQDTDIRQIGGVIYFFEPAPAVAHSPALLPIFQRVSLQLYRDQFAKAPQTTALGRSIIDGVQLVGYQTNVTLVGQNASDPKTFGQSVDYPTKLWFSASTGFPARIEIGQPLTILNVFYDINAKIDDIGPP